MIDELQQASTAVAQRAANAQRAWNDAGMAVRLSVLQTAGRALVERSAELRECLLVDGLSREMAAEYGHFIVEQARPDRLADYARQHARWCPTDAGGELMVRRPDGVVLLVTPSNSPTINGASIFTILLPGNAVIARAPANDTGMRFLVEQILGPALRQHDLPETVAQVITAPTRELLGSLLPQPSVDTLVFFGNSTAGASVAERAAELGKKAVLELEGSDYMLVWKDADLDAAVASAVRIFDFSTQPCLVPKHFLVHEEIFDRFVDSFLAAVPDRSRTVERDPERGRLVPVGRPQGFDAALEQLRPLGVVRCGGHRMNADGCPEVDGRYVAPTVVCMDDAAIEGKRLLSFDEEITFPLAPVVRVQGDDHDVLTRMCRILHRSPFGLRASVWTGDPSIIQRFTREIHDVGLLVFNDEHARTPVYASPWGGRKRSGGPNGESHMFWQRTSHLQAICCNTLDEAQIDAVTSGLGLDGILERPRRPRAHAVADIEASASQPVLSRRHEGGLVEIVLNRPHRHNAVDEVMRAELERITATLASDPELRGIVIRGAGRSFCSGADLSVLEAATVDDARRFMVGATWAFRRLEQLPVPVLAAVSGYCFGGGLELALHCDEIVAADDAVFCLPESQLGLITTAGTAQRLSAAVGTSRARSMLISGRRVGADEAREMGLVARVVPRVRLDQAIAEWSETRCKGPRGGVAAIKAVMRALHDPRSTQAWISELETFEGLLAARIASEVSS